ncbi:DUF6268 family outer membrane beta-barrel protein [Synoicihabitans lomoniglobus]|uniref:DUF6268 family outer membrane beta-barrel protein n=1 Tax=Synoicihabitans lomoniglobus TaxID=2909285 RepID=A0AAF0CMI1_9BACT|nr:DUF6268 family outer membrane beta-barrel protein [Opitutaceae bacterium LMO-M01]WED63065.1 DUF6268 family outer membrane beta-barrel protein [Opitutaceae bacterium LMO-M01]
MSSDEGGFSSDGFRLSAIVSVGHKVSPTFRWNAGFAASTEGDYPVLPMLGLQWEFSPDWTLAFGFPKTEVIYQMSPQLSFNAGLCFQGGSYAISTVNAPGLNDTHMDYREFRLGGGLSYRPSAAIELRLDGGAVINRRFDYYDRNFEIKGDSAAYVELTMKLRF